MVFVRFIALLSVFILGMTYGNYSSANDLTDLLGDFTKKYVSGTIDKAFNGTGSGEMETAQSGAPHFLHLKKGYSLRTAPSINADKHKIANKAALVKNLRFTGNEKLVEENRGNTNAKFRSRWYELTDSNGGLYYVSSSGVPQKTQTKIKELVTKGVLQPPALNAEQKNTSPIQGSTNCKKSSSSYSYKGLTCNDRLTNDKCIEKAFKNQHNGFAFGKLMKIKKEYNSKEGQTASNSFDRIFISEKTSNPRKNTAKLFNSQNVDVSQAGKGNFCTNPSGIAVYKMSYFNAGNFVTKIFVLTAVPVEQDKKEDPQGSEVLEDLGVGQAIDTSY